MCKAREYCKKRAEILPGHFTPETKAGTSELARRLSYLF